MHLSSSSVSLFVSCFVSSIRFIASAPTSVNSSDYTPTLFEDPVLNFVREHPHETLPPWPGQMNLAIEPSVLQSDLKQVKEDLVTRITELKEEGQRLKTSIENSSGATQTQIDSLKTEVFDKIHEVQDQVSKQKKENLPIIC